MDPESKKLLEKTFELAEENNKMLHKVRGVQKREFLWRILKYAVIIAIAFGSFYYLEPYVNKLVDLYNGAKTNIEGFNSTIDNFKNTN